MNPQTTMPTLRYIVYASILLCPPSAAPAQDRQPIAGRIDAVLERLPHAEAVVGVSVVDLATGDSVYERNADLPLIPASNTKVFVMATALAVLGPEFEFETTLATDGTNLFLIGGGDPALGDQRLCRERGESRTAQFERWAQVLRGQGVESLPGDLFIDESLFDDQRINSTWEASDLGKWYAAPVGALNFNDNCVDITIRPGKNVGSPTIVSIQPEGARISTKNKCTTGHKGKPILHHPPGTLEYVISGSCAKKWPFRPVSHPDPGKLAGDSLLWALRQKGVRIEGEFRRQRVRTPDGLIPDNLTIVGRFRTPLADVLQRIGKNSQNLFAECLIKRVGYDWARTNGMPSPHGSWELGFRAIRATLELAGINTANLVVADGSGLSRGNRCTARQLTSVLAWVDGQPFGPLFRKSLSNAGLDGSLRKRLTDLPGHVLGKTGTMRGIRTLSGFVASEDGPTYAFAVLFNSYKGPSTPYKRLQDRICRILARSARAETGTR